MQLQFGHKTSCKQESTQGADYITQGDSKVVKRD
jgi:hypothetical protein